MSPAKIDAKMSITTLWCQLNKRSLPFPPNMPSRKDQSLRAVNSAGKGQGQFLPICCFVSTQVRESATIIPNSIFANVMFSAIVYNCIHTFQNI